MNARIPSPSPHPSPPIGAARCAVVALALACAAWAARAVWQLRLSVSGMPASGPPHQGDGEHRPLSALENSYHLVSAVGDVITVLCAVTFLFWLLRVRENAVVLSGRSPRYALPWVYAGWIVPLANLWVPRGIIVDVHRASAPDEQLPRVVNWWWGLWIAGLLSGVGLVYSVSTDEVIVRAYDNVYLLLVADLTLMGAAVAAILLVRALTAAQRTPAEAPAPPTRE